MVGKDVKNPFRSTMSLFRVPNLLVPMALMVLMGFLPGTASLQAQEGSEKARQILRAAIDALGGQKYLDMRVTASNGRYYRFRNDRKAYTQYWDWTMYQPVKWRFQMGEGKRQLVQVYNLELGKGWTLEGKSTVEEAPQEAIESFEKGAKQDLDVLLRFRAEEEGMNLYYYGPDDIAGQGLFEAVEFLDATNDSVVVFFNRDSHLPVKVETHFTDDAGVRHKQEVEYSNWHIIDGVNLPLRHDVFVDESVSTQRFVESIQVNPTIPESIFLEPVPEK